MLPDPLDFKCASLNSGVSVSQVKVRSDTQGTRTGGSQVTFTLPTASLFDLKSMKLWFNITNNDTNQYITPRVADHFIRQLTVQVNGSTVSNIEYYGTIAGYLRDMEVSGSEISSNALSYERAIDASSSAKIPVDGFKFGFLSGDWMRYLDTTLFKNVVITITLANPWTIAGPATPAALNNNNVVYTECYLTCNNVGFNDDTYRALLKEEVQSEKGLDVFYKNMQVFPSTQFTGSIDWTFRVTSGSLDKLYGLVKYVDATKGNWLATSGTALSPYANSVGNAGLTYYYTVGGARVIMYDADDQEAFSILRNAVDVKATNTYATWLSTDFCMATTLCLPHIKSGYNSFNSAVDIMLHVQGHDAYTKILLACAEMTSNVNLSDTNGVTIRT